MSKQKLMDTMLSDDFEFYTMYLSDLPLEEQAEFFKEFPDFLEEPIRHFIDLEHDKFYKKIVQK